MITGFSLAVDVAGYLTAFAITVLSGYYTFRQRLTSFQLIREYLLLVYFVIVILMGFDFARTLTDNAALLTIYPLFSFGLGFLEAILLLSAAVGGYLRPTGSSYSLLVQDLRARPRQIVMFLLFIAGIVGAEAYLVLFKPYTIVTARDFAGGTVMAVNYSETFSAAVGGLFFVFLAYPVGLLVVGALRTPNPQMRSAQLGLAIGFAVTSGTYLLSSLALFNFDYDATAVAYIVLSVVFGLAARNFRRGAVLAGFVSPAPLAPLLAKEERTATKDGRTIRFQDGQLVLLEVDTDVKYEESLGELVRDLLSEKRGVFVISARGSRVYNFLSTVPGLRLYTMSESTHYIAPSTTRSDEVNVPLFDGSVLLQVIDRTVDSAESTAIVFDSISDMMIYSGFESCYKFLKEAGSITSGTRAVALFLLFAGAEEGKRVTAVRSVFPSQLRITAQGIEIVR